MKNFTFTRAARLALLAVSAALPLTACVAPGPYGGYGSQPQYAQPAYAQPSYAQPQPQPSYAQPAYVQPDGYGTQYGTVARVVPIGGATSPSGVVGTLVGAVAGGVIGNQFGGGHGREAATVIGALGGAVAGNQLGQRVGQPSGYRVDIQLSDGSMRSFDLQTPGDLRPGDRVRIDGNQVSRY
ncbi:glycine zipper 2TM domain-containing protein [Trinickia sp. LjRoot230]|uniref:glycine zipper 2TM domain-containing protein n=1 Tax=Trinickia sp. LjRoot230 TaxID=3342288 RepID=UPI003ECDC4C3